MHRARSTRLARPGRALLLQVVPPHISVEAVRGDLAGLDAVVDADVMREWTLTSDMEVVSPHLMVHPDADTPTVLDAAGGVLAERYATVQVEPDTHEGCEEVTW